MQALKSRRVHLLGGSPNSQIALINKIRRLGGQVISVDGNGFQRHAKYAKVWESGRFAAQPDGKSWLHGDRYNTMLASAKAIQNDLQNTETFIQRCAPTVRKKRIADTQFRLF